MGSIRLLRESDDRARFESGDEHLDRYFRMYAGQNQFRHRVSVTYICEEAGEAIGYLTVAGGEIKSEKLPMGAKKLPSYPLPILRIARLAVARSARGMGIGSQLLHHGFSLAIAMATATGCVGVLVDPKPGAEEFYRRFGFEPTEVVEGALLTNPGPVPHFISLRRVEAALSK
jgi:GNAT superfamily N-acetyltransferase